MIKSICRALLGACLATLPTNAAAASAAAAGCSDFRGYGDLNGDGAADAVVGEPTADAGEATAAGAVTIVYGRLTSPRPDHAERLTQGDGVVPGEPASGNGFGTVIRVGYADADACADVFLGVPGQFVEGARRAGAVIVLYGSEAGLGRGRPAAVWTEATAGVPGAPEDGDRFGTEIAVPTGYHRDQRPTIAIGAPGRSVDGVLRAGAVFTAQLDLDGALQTGSVLRFDQTLEGLEDEPEAGDRFGEHLAVTDLGPTPPTIVVGVPNESVGMLERAGAVVELTGVLPGETPRGVRWTEDDLHVDDAAEAGDRFGAAVSYSRDPITSVARLAVGAPQEDVVRRDDGRVFFVEQEFGGDREAAVFDQSVASFAERPERGDHFGASTLMLPYQITFSQAFLIIGVPGEDLSGRSDAGLVHKVALESGTQTSLHQATAGIPGEPGDGDRFGAVLGGFPATAFCDVAGALMLGLPEDSQYPDGAVLVTRFPLVGADPEDPKYRPQVWRPGKGVFDPEAERFGDSVGGYGGVAGPG